MKRSVDKTNKGNKGLYFFAFVFAVFFAWVINKEVEIPTIILGGMAFLGLLVVLFYGLRRPEVPFYALVIYFPFNDILVGDFGGYMTAFNMTNILIALTVFAWISHKMERGGVKFEKDGLNWAILIFCVMGIVSVVQLNFKYGSPFMENLTILKRWLTPVILYYVALNVIEDRKMLRNTVTIMMIVVFVAGLLAIKEGIDIGDASSLDRSRVGGISRQPNTLGAFFVYYMFLFLGFFYMNWTRIKSWGLLIPFLVCFRGIQLTYSRGAYIAFAFGLAAITFFKSKALFVLLCLGIVFAVLNPQWLPGGLRYAVTRTTTGDAGIYDVASLEQSVDPSSARRIEIWKGALEMIKDYPIFGVGYGLFSSAIPYYAPGVGTIDAHNTYIIIAAEMGIPALIVFVIVLFMIFYKTFWLYRNVKDLYVKAVALGMLGGVAGLMMANMFGSRLNSEEIAAYFWILAGLIVKATIMHKRNQLKEGET